VFEAKRAKYSVSDTKRQSLLDQVDYYISKLKSLLESCDKMTASSPMNDQWSMGKIKRLYKTQLAYWKHAERAYRLICQAWKCDCMTLHRASVWLGGLVAQSPVSLSLVFRSHLSNDHVHKTWDEQALQIVSVDGFAEIPTASSSKAATPAVRFAMAEATGLATHSHDVYVWHRMCRDVIS